MAEYIDSMKPLIEEFMTEWRIQHDDNVVKAVADVGIVVDKPRLMQALTDAKAFYDEGYMAAMGRADVVVVRHGKYVQASKRAQIGLKCSICGARIKYSEYFNGNHHYCYKCGAKMDGVTDTNVGKIDGKGDDK